MCGGKASVLLAGGSPGPPDDGCHAKGCVKSVRAARGDRLLIELMRSCCSGGVGLRLGIVYPSVLQVASYLCQVAAGIVEGSSCLHGLSITETTEHASSTVASQRGAGAGATPEAVDAMPATHCSHSYGSFSAAGHERGTSQTSLTGPEARLGRRSA